MSTSAGGPYSSGDEVVSGTAGVPNSDDIRLTGIGSKVHWAGLMTDAARLEVGIEGTLLPTLGSGAAAPRSLDITGSGTDEYVYTSFLEGHGRQRFDLGGGDDFLLSPDGMAGDGSTYVGGPGQDEIDLRGGKRLAVDLAARTWTSRQGGRDIRGRGGSDTLEFSRPRRLASSSPAVPGSLPSRCWAGVVGTRSSAARARTCSSVDPAGTGSTATRTATAAAARG